MTYFGFLALFLGLPLLAMGWLTWRDRRQGLGLPAAWLAPSAWAVLGVHLALAVVYTTPWDNYLVATRVWYYDPARVTGLTLGWVPIEEYTFFVLQTSLTGLWLLWLARRLPATPVSGRRSPRLHRVATLVTGLIWTVSLAILVTRWAPGAYLALTLVWMLPPVMLQLAVGAGALWQHRRWVLWSLLPPVLYLSAADALAIGAGIWTINPAKTIGVRLGGVLPVEEFVFFSITNILIVFGMSLMLAKGHELRNRLWQSGRRSQQEEARGY
jgi:lycopene cyclase domain-containing protein